MFLALIFLYLNEGDALFDGNQLITIKWNNTNKDWYVQKGYKFTKRSQEFQVKAKDLTPHSDAKVDMVCDYCGATYKTNYCVAMNGYKRYPKDACCHCASLKTNDVNYDKRAKRICLENNYELITTAYSNAKMDIEFICPIHGEQTMLLENLLHGHKCIKCSYEERGDNMGYDKQYIKSVVESYNGNILLNPNEYKDVITRNLRIRCSCGNIYITSFVNYFKHNVRQCYSCSCKESIGEKRIREYLESHNIDFVQEKRFPDCRKNKPLPFDFYLPQYNLIIEFDGQQHFKNVGFMDYETTKENDKIKNQYCQSHNIDLLRIPYWEGNNIESIISKRINL